ncbi:hypothetical protein Nepgr_013629 [Nepenthes gracilis]|uniref:beta-amyrin 28-monooxygenase n=1 Tax=Nepenthes gracilis TaxID=150966 RepID=A0AAD3XP61_NEPGR|nr:hypothetical protein Nepgr_013629 [Nepenthes gracilis]
MNKFSTECFKTSILGEPVAVMCRAAGNKFLFSNEDKLVTGWWPDSVKKIFPARSDQKEETKRLRRLLPQFLKPEALKSYIGTMDIVARSHFASAWENKEEVVVFPLAKRYTFLLACRLFMSLEDSNCIARFDHSFQLLVPGIFSIPIDLPGMPFNRAIKASNIIRKQLMKIIKQRKIDLAEKVTTQTQDILSHMLTVTDDQGYHMDDLDIADKILGLLIGGHDTTSIAITFVVFYLAELPHIYNMVYEEQMEIVRSKASGELLNWDDIQKMKYSWNVACEAMRLMPPLQGGFREAIQNFTYAGFFVPKGWKLYWNAYSTHTDCEYFPEPEKFDPTRFEGNGPAPYTYVPFGGGPKMCPGKEYARLEILVFIYNLVKRFKWEKCSFEETKDEIPQGKKSPRGAVSSEVVVKFSSALGGLPPISGLSVLWSGLNWAVLMDIEQILMGPAD